MEAVARLSRRQYGESKGSHAHDHFQLLWGWHGALELEIEGRGTRVVAGRLAVIAPGQRHDFWSAGGSTCFVLDANDSAHPALAALAGRVLPLDGTALHLLRFLASRHDLADLQGPATALLLSTLPSEAAAPRRTRRPIDWGRLDAWIDAHLGEPLDVADLAAQACLSPSQFTARCLAETGQAPMAYVRERRLAAARRLRAQGLQVQEVALRCGYRSPSALTAALRRRG
ncbi:helix-turn-helix domain-containing protein [Caldimonas taiwanensis]|uniref:helix-turn-helix domain-containing protein n=1 Tax=Caldimonas taiwanensis TaxID=307483 RepID=UPI000783612F|nr:AraC family transcriptional regulator [Caldimonas taiwanensis]